MKDDGIERQENSGDKWNERKTNMNVLYSEGFSCRHCTVSRGGIEDVLEARVRTKNV